MKIEQILQMYCQSISSVKTFKFNKGMTLIELFILLTLTSVVLYISYLVLKPQNTLNRLNLIVNEVQEITRGMRAYQSATGYWPSGSNENCADALNVLSQHDSNVFIKGVNLNVFGKPYLFECNLDVVGSPLYLTTYVPAVHLSFFKRYLYGIEIRNEENGFVEITTKIPSIHSDIKTYIVSEPYGKPVLLFGEEGDESARYADIDENKAFIPLPEGCNAEHVMEFAFFSNGLCPELSPSIDEEVLEIYVRYKYSIYAGVFPLYDVPYLRLVKIFREYSLVNWQVKHVPCEKNKNSLNCQSSSMFDGWLVEATPSYNIRYRVEYYDRDGNVQNGTSEYFNWHDFYTEGAFESSVFNTTTLMRKFHHPNYNPQSIMSRYVSLGNIVIDEYNAEIFFSYSKNLDQRGFIKCNNYRESEVDNISLIRNVPIINFKSKIHGFITCSAN